MSTTPTSARSHPGCAYCGKHGNLTREHILPGFLYRQFPDQKLGYNSSADKFMKWEATVRDVCAACNNGPLSQLDQYARVLLENIDCGRTYTERATLRFRYDYHLLVRWLLKVSFNAARGLSTPPTLLSNSVPYILNAEMPPVIAFVAVEVIRDTPISESERATLPEAARNWRHVPTQMFRVGPALLVPPMSGKDALPPYCLRFVAINSWYFSVCLVASSQDRADRRRLVRLFRQLEPDAVILGGNNSSATVRVSRKTFAEAYALQGRRTAEKWRQYERSVSTRHSKL
jgi:hypothetical protein